MNSPDKLNETVEKTAPYIFPKYGSGLDGSFVTKEYTFSDEEIQRIQKISNGNPLGEMSIVLSGTLLFLWRCQPEDKITVDVAMNQHQYHPFRANIVSESSLRDFLIATQKNFFDDLSTATLNIFNTGESQGKRTPHKCVL